MNRISAVIVFVSVAFSTIGCVVRTYPEHAHRHHHREHRDVVIVHRG